MNPQEFEELVRDHYRQSGYEANTTSYGNDYGVDIFATKGNEKIAIQAKMYGNTTRKINRQMVMELHGAKDYFDCIKAVIATDGQLLPDASEVARKLGIEILYINALSSTVEESSTVESTASESGIAETSGLSFETIWQQYIMPLKGQTLYRENGDSNLIVNVDWSGVERISSNGRKKRIKIEIFKLTVKKLLDDEYISRDYINQHYADRASSGVILILRQIPFFSATKRPAGLRYEKKRI